MQKILFYVLDNSNRIYPIIKEEIACDDLHDGLCYVMPNGYAISSEDVVKKFRTHKEAYLYRLNKMPRNEERI